MKFLFLIILSIPSLVFAQTNELILEPTYRSELSNKPVTLHPLRGGKSIAVVQGLGWYDHRNTILLVSPEGKTELIVDHPMHASNTDSTCYKCMFGSFGTDITLSGNGTFLLRDQIVAPPKKGFDKNHYGLISQKIKSNFNLESPINYDRNLFGDKIEYSFPNSSKILTSDYQSTDNFLFRVVDLQKKKVLAQFLSTRYFDSLWGVPTSIDGKIVAVITGAKASNNYRYAEIFSTDTGKKITEIENIREDGWNFRFHNLTDDGKLFYGLTVKGYWQPDGYKQQYYIDVYSVEVGQYKCSIPHDGGFSVSGSEALVASIAEKQLQLWNLEDCTRTNSISFDTDTVNPHYRRGIIYVGKLENNIMFLTNAHDDDNYVFWKLNLETGEFRKTPRTITHYQHHQHLEVGINQDLFFVSRDQNRKTFIEHLSLQGWK